jgi:V8-like Glu-specific endopeptidase
MRLGSFRLQGKSRLIALIAVCIAAVAGIVATVILSPSAATATAIPIGSATAGQASTVGALFTRTSSGQLTSHFCTGSVVDSPAGDLVVTAAHCVSNRTPSQIAFIPDYANGHSPYGDWTVTQVIVDQQWTSSADPDDDFAFLIVHQPGSQLAVQSLTGGEVLGVSQPAARTVQVNGYPDDLDNAITCQNAATDFSPTQFEFDCGGFTDGTSGSPLLVQTGPAETIIGVIGGYQQGGDTSSVSYAARFSTDMATLYQNALAAAGG